MSSDHLVISILMHAHIQNHSFHITHTHTHGTVQVLTIYTVRYTRKQAKVNYSLSVDPEKLWVKYLQVFLSSCYIVAVHKYLDCIFSIQWFFDYPNLLGPGCVQMIRKFSSPFIYIQNPVYLL